MDLTTIIMLCIIAVLISGTALMLLHLLEVFIAKRLERPSEEDKEFYDRQLDK